MIIVNAFDEVFHSERERQDSLTLLASMTSHQTLVHKCYICYHTAQIVHSRAIESVAPIVTILLIIFT